MDFHGIFWTFLQYAGFPRNLLVFFEIPEVFRGSLNIPGDSWTFPKPFNHLGNPWTTSESSRLSLSLLDFPAVSRTSPESPSLPYSLLDFLGVSLTFPEFSELLRSPRDFSRVPWVFSGVPGTSQSLRELFGVFWTSPESPVL